MRQCRIDAGLKVIVDAYVFVSLCFLEQIVGSWQHGGIGA
jgi:hypothetical protein